MIATGKAAWTKARPTRAGLNTLKPRPPNIALPMAIPATAATSAIHNGKPGGRVSASSIPVMVALQSLRVEGRPASQLK